MVTRILVRTPILRKKKASAAKADESNHDNKHQGKGSNDKYKYYTAVQAQVNEKESLFCSTKGCLYDKAANDKFCYFCDGKLCYDVPLQGKPNDEKMADSNEVNSCQQNNDIASKKRPLLTSDAFDTSEKTKRLKGSKFIDLTDVPPQLPILKSKGKGGASKYIGVCFDKSVNTKNKWKTQIRIDGKKYDIGAYDNEEEAAVDYARAVFKYKGERQMQTVIDLTDVPQQVPIMSSKKNCSSAYEGVYLHKATNKWKVQISIDGRQHYIGYYDNEEEAAVDYARAVFKYRPEDSQKQKRTVVDLTDVPQQVPIMSSKKNCSSAYEGVSFDKAKNKWRATIVIDGKATYIGGYQNEEEAAVDYARAVFKYRPDRQKQKQTVSSID